MSPLKVPIDGTWTGVTGLEPATFRSTGDVWRQAASRLRSNHLSYTPWKYLCLVVFGFEALIFGELAHFLFSFQGSEG